MFILIELIINTRNANVPNNTIILQIIKVVHQMMRSSVITSIQLKF